jgi:hypothetical protein
MHRDITRIHGNLIQQKRVLLLGDTGDETVLSTGDDDLQNTVRRVKELFPRAKLTTTINPGKF